MKNFLYDITQFSLGFILKYWSYLPFLALTDDGNFGTNIFKKSKKKRRFSIINIMFGSRIFYFFTFSFEIEKYNSDKKYNENRIKKKIKYDFYKKLELDADDKFLKNDEKYELKSKVNNYENHLSKISLKKAEKEEEFLKYLIEGDNLRLEKCYNKINAYTAIFLMVIPFSLAIFQQFYSEEAKKIILDNFDKLMVIVFFYCILNLMQYICDSMKVRGVAKSQFSDFKKKSAVKNYIGSYYSDWYSNRKFTELIVSYVSNIQDWIIITLFLGITFCIKYFSKNF